MKKFGLLKRMESIFKKKHVSDASEESKLYIELLCEETKEAHDELERLKIEYTEVTTNLTDLQKIEMLPASTFQKLSEIGTEIKKLSDGRLKYQTALNEMNQERFKSIEPHLNELPKVLKMIKALEDRQSLINNDLRQLEGEKGYLQYQQSKDIAANKRMKKNAYIFLILFGISLIILLIGNLVYQTDMFIPGAIITFIGGIYISYFYFRRRAIIYGIQLGDKKIQRVIKLLNKTKIKYVNNKHHLDYEYLKYQTNSYQELTYKWEQFQKLQTEKSQYHQVTNYLASHEDNLIGILKKYQISDSSLFSYDVELLTNPKKLNTIKNEWIQVRDKVQSKLKQQISLYESNMDKLNKLKKISQEDEQMIQQLMMRFNLID